MTEDPEDAKRRFALEVVRRLHDNGHQALLAGGCVRDMLMGREPTDYDVATSALPDQVRALFRRSLAVGASFGVIVVQGSPESGDIEVATFRSDGEYQDGRRPATVRFSSPREDAQRRDFTINGLFFDPVEDRIIDYVGGQEDMKAGLLRAIGRPHDRFTEDKLRLLRAVRFAARFGLRIEPETSKAIRAMAPQIHVVSAERIAQEMRKMLPHSSRAEAMRLMRAIGLSQELLPEAEAMIGLEQNKPAMPGCDLWEHSLKVLESLPGDPGFPLALAALLHDSGKPDCMANDGGKRTFYGHEFAGRKKAAAVCSRWKLSTAETDRVTWLVEHHQYLGAATTLRESKLKRIMAHPGIHDLIDLHEADALASTGDVSQAEYCRFYLREQPQGPIDPPLLFTGHDLARLGVKPGPIFKKVLDKIREAQLDRLITDKRQATEMACKLCSEIGDTDAADA
jgi:poly(A) polymerase